MKDYYKILGISPGCSADGVKKAYRRSAKRYHPDMAKNSNLPEGERQRLAEKFKEVNEANTVLSHPGKRNRYNRTLKQDGHPFFQTFSKSESPKKTQASNRPEAKPEKRETKEKPPSSKKQSSREAGSYRESRPETRTTGHSSSFRNQQTWEDRRSGSPHSPAKNRRHKQKHSQERRKSRTFNNRAPLSGMSTAVNGSYQQYKNKKKVHGIIVMVLVGLSFLLVIFLFSLKTQEPSKTEPGYDNLVSYPQSHEKKIKRQVMMEIYQKNYSDKLSKFPKPPSPETGKPGESRLSPKKASSPDRENPPENPTLLDQIWNGANIR